jgi:hypothetical protein
MIPRCDWWAFRFFGRRISVSIDRCVHYCAFRYGREEEHPYETYARLLVRDGDRGAARRWFVDFIRHYRPRDFGAALGLDLGARHGLWNFPWDRARPGNEGWFSDPLSFDDIVTQYCEEGLLWFRIEQEFFWLERSIYSIRRNGYHEKPHFGIFARRFIREDGEEAFLILDGNHRLSALSAIGHRSVDLSYLPRGTVREADAPHWPKVLSGEYDERDARLIFRAYFSGNQRWRIASEPAPLLELPPAGEHFL